MVRSRHKIQDQLFLPLECISERIPTDDPSLELANQITSLSSNVGLILNGVNSVADLIRLRTELFLELSNLKTYRLYLARTDYQEMREVDEEISTLTTRIEILDFEIKKLNSITK